MKSIVIRSAMIVAIPGLVILGFEAAYLLAPAKEIAVWAPQLDATAASVSNRFLEWQPEGGGPDWQLLKATGQKFYFVKRPWPPMFWRTEASVIEVDFKDIPIDQGLLVRLHVQDPQQAIGPIDNR